MKTAEAIIHASIKSTLLTGVSLFLMYCGAMIWLFGTKALPDDLGFGYYRDFHIARKAIEQSACAESIEYSRHEDVTLESFHFKIDTQSGWLVSLWFHKGMDVGEVCSNPPGFLVAHPHNRKFQGYSIAELSARLADKGIQVSNVNDILCNMGELAPMFKTNYNNEDIPLVTYEDADFDRYLSIEIVEPGREDDFIYTRIR